MQSTKKGCLIATLQGEDDENQVTVSAHMDTLGAMVKEITSDGKRKYHKIGGGCCDLLNLKTVL